MKALLLLCMALTFAPPAADPPRCTVYAIQDTSNPRHKISRPLKPDPLRVVDSVSVAPDSVGITVIALLKRQDVDFVGYKCDQP